MKKYDYLIIGGGIAGVTAAETIREQKADATIGIVEDEPYVLYSRVLLPGYLKKKVAREQLFLRKVDDFTQKRIDLHLREGVSFVDVKRKEAGLTNGLVFGYDKLLIAAGGKVAGWGKPEDQEFIFRLQTLDDADRLEGSLDLLQRPLVIGGSFISLELLEIFVTRGIKPVLLVRSPHFLARIFDPIAGEMLRDNFERHGIETQFDDEVAETTKRGNLLEVQTKGLRKIQCDALAVGAGIQCNIKFLEGSGIELGEKGVRANEYLETNQEEVWAAGDVAEFYDVILGRHHIVGNWSNAFLQGQRVGLNMTGQREPFRKVSGYSITNLGFQITALGDTSDASDTVARFNKITNQYERFFIREGTLVGAAFINRFQDKPHLAKLMEARVSVESYREQLKDFEFDIKNIPV